MSDDDNKELKGTGPDGSIFERTEIKSRAHRQLERLFERHAGRVDLDA
jgi:hypothetical protein